jgi:hypothetical protein
MLSLVVAGWFLRRSGSRVSIPMACRHVSAIALSLPEIPMPLRTTRKSTRPRASDRSMVATPHNHNGLPVSGPNRRRRYQRKCSCRDGITQGKTYTSVFYGEGAGCREPNPRIRRREKNVLDMPSYRSGDYTSNWLPVKLDFQQQCGARVTRHLTRAVCKVFPPSYRSRPRVFRQLYDE